MKVLIVNGDNSIIDIGAEALVSEDRIEMNNVAYVGVGLYTVHDVPEIPPNIVTGKYTYTVGEGFQLNPNYKEYLTPEQQIDFLKAENNKIKADMATQNQTFSDFMDYIFTAMPELA